MEGIDFLSKTMYLEDRTVRLQLWDTGTFSPRDLVYRQKLTFSWVSDMKPVMKVLTDVYRQVSFPYHLYTGKLI
jgi:hypothetical protein